MKTFLACEQVVHLGDSREVTGELQAKRNVGARGFTARSSVLSQLASLAIIGELSRRLIFFKQDIEFMSSHCCQD